LATSSAARPPDSRSTAVSGFGVAGNLYGYDPRGLRIRKQDSEGTKLLHLDGDHLDACYDDSGAVRAKYLRGTVIDEVVNGYVTDDEGALLSYTYHHDTVNSVVALTGHAGATEETTRYAPFGEELAVMLREVSLGKLRRDALKELSERTGVPDLSSFINAVIQAESMGTSIAAVLRVQAEQMRMKRRQRAEQQAQAAPIKMMFPLVLCIFPTLFLVILGPAGIQIYHQLVANGE